MDSRGGGGSAVIVLGSSSTNHGLLEDITRKAADQRKHIEVIFQLEILNCDWWSTRVRSALGPREITVSRRRRQVNAIPVRLWPKYLNCYSFPSTSFRMLTLIKIFRKSSDSCTESGYMVSYFMIPRTQPS